MIRGDKIKLVADIFNLPPHIVRGHLLQEGRFNMLKAVVDFIKEKQDGQGICAVSEQYARECENMYSLFWKPSVSSVCRRRQRAHVVEGLDNPMLEEARFNGDNLQEEKARAKAEIQDLYKLDWNPDARLFVSLGRIVRQKGVDLLADVAPWLLSTFPNAQLVVIGPIVDGYGHYARERLSQLARQEEFSGRMYVLFEFARVPDDLKLAADFCLMPSRDEPFGYVDIEFAWRGAVIVGAQAGGLGKVPGFYYVAQNRENLRRLRRELRTAITLAMKAPRHHLERMSRDALACEFPVEQWQARLLSQYARILPPLGPPPSSDIQLDSSPSSSRAQQRSTILSGPSEALAGTTFRPYNVGSAGSAPQHTSVLRSGMEPQMNHMESTYFTARAEFIRQEPTEEELSERVKAKLAEHSACGIDVVLESIGSDLNMERESFRMPRLLASPIFGVPLIHVVVSIGYVASPVPALLTSVVATEWGLRGGAEFPHWLQKLLTFAKFAGKSDSLDPSLLAMVLFFVNGAACSMGAPIWALLARCVQPRILLAACFFINIPVIATVFPIEPNVALAVLLVFAQGLASSGLYLFVSFNFMLSVKPDMSECALRMGILEACRSFLSWLLNSYVFLASPSQIAGTSTEPIPMKMVWLLTPLAVLMTLFSLVPGVLCLWAPGPYRDDRAPRGGSKMIWSRWTVVFLGLSEVVGGLIAFPNTRFMTWWLENGWPIDRLGSICILVALGMGTMTLAWAELLRKAAVHGYYLLIGVALLLAPPALLRTVALEEVSTYTFLGTSTSAFLLCVFSVLLEIIRGSAIWAVKIQVLNSRWRLLSYDSLLLAMIGFATMLSPVLCEGLARRASSHWAACSTPSSCSRFPSCARTCASRARPGVRCRGASRAARCCSCCLRSPALGSWPSRSSARRARTWPSRG
mmetsp:Transcript_25539/g.82315  ORF Transcript_25539/g.82315 Transcript_25539/m.82315 type:complete len:921 (+) Transcript_25539:203-2965(+)